jgi:hypothetical protein
MPIPKKLAMRGRFFKTPKTTSSALMYRITSSSKYSARKLARKSRHREVQNGDILTWSLSPSVALATRLRD